MLSSVSSEEAFGSSMIEAMACANPLSYLISKLSEMIGTNCRLSFARERTVSSYDRDNIAKQTHAIYREVIG